MLNFSSTRTQYTGRIIGFTPMLKKREIRKERKRKGERKIDKEREREIKC